ncbi:hypothetical protein FOJ82_11935 [Tessaracoccus rhinocerotis]|uniref:Uncharacterized protein n=1 Tax=Tessaracoccus rhinocerotis TaxID=1689449 RepID=A0A553JXT6_9ACTN|nr:hypothetical protein [Tessaracoccus rhinocerotis]TRY17263.1 hypothetical protein FOJ82_11935 [Tessaracoccus rhinocerotis]
MSTNNDGQAAGHDEERQVKDAPLRRSEEDADRHNPDVGGDNVSEESAESFEKWEQDETE